MKKIILLFMTLLLTTGVMQSQVKIGDNVAPEKGAILDLNGTVTQGGLLLPNVSITDLGKIPTTFTDASVQGQDRVDALAGMIVWNTNTDSGKGISPGVYMWDGDNWKMQKAETGSLPAGCVNSTLPAGKLCFMTYNLGANPTMTIAQQMAYVPGSLSGTTANTDSTVYGALYQWGRWTDGHQLRTSSAIAGPVGSAGLDATTGQVIPTNAAFGRFITNSAIPVDWRTPQLNTLWGPSMPSSNPCPTGWHVPSISEWQSVSPASTAKNNWVMVLPSATSTGGFLVIPDGVNPTLFLPFSGTRSYTGGLGQAGTIGYFWTPDITGTNSIKLTVEQASPYTTYDAGNRAFGFSIRCALN